MKQIFKMILSLSLIFSTHLAQAQSAPERAEELDKYVREIYVRGSLDGQKVYWVLPLSSLSYDKATDLQMFGEVVFPLFKAKTYVDALDYLVGEKSPVEMFRVAAEYSNKIWQESKIELKEKNGRVKGNASVRSTLILINNIQYLVLEVPTNAIKSIGAMAGATLWNAGAACVITGAGGAMAVVAGASLTVYLMRASYSVLSTTGTAAIYLMNKDVKDIYKMVIRQSQRQIKNKCSQAALES